MKIAICGSMAFSKEMQALGGELVRLGYEAVLPQNTDRYISGEMTAKENFGEKLKDDLIRKHYRLIADADAVLVANYDKGGVRNYVGGNSFLEAGFAHVLGKKLYFVNGIPDMPYSDELRAMQPIILNGDLSEISS